MSQRIRMIINNLWDTATLNVAVGTEIGSLPITHSQQYGRSKTSVIVPNISDTSAIEFDLPGLTLASGLVIYRHFLSSVAKWRLELFEEAGQTGTKVFDSTLIDCVQTKTLGDLDWLVDPLVASTFDDWPYKFSQLWFDGVFFQSGRLTIVDAEAANGVHEFDRIYLGTVLQPGVNFDYGHQHAWDSTENSQRAVSGSSFGAQRPTFRKLAFNLAWIDELERPHFSEANRKVGKNRDWFISMFPEQGGQKELEYAMACKYTTIPAITGNFYNNYSIPISVEEA
jgi:hypothetical protein